MPSHTVAIPSPPASRGAIRMARPIRRLSLWLFFWFSRARRGLDVLRQRRQLATLSNRQLADIGITREEAVDEAARPFWDLPAK